MNDCSLFVPLPCPANHSPESTLTGVEFLLGDLIGECRGAIIRLCYVIDVVLNLLVNKAAGAPETVVSSGLKQSGVSVPLNIRGLISVNGVVPRMAVIVPLNFQQNSGQMSALNAEQLKTSNLLISSLLVSEELTNTQLRYAELITANSIICCESFGT